MIVSFTLFQILAAFFSFGILSILYRYLLRPLLLLQYYQKQGGITIFHRKLLGYFTNLENTLKVGDYFHLYNQAVKKNPKAPFIAENFGDKVVFVPTDSEMIKEVLKRHEAYHKAMDILGLLAELGKGSIFFSEEKAWKIQRRAISGAFSFDSMRHVVPMIVDVTQERFEEWIRSGDLTDMNLLNNAGGITGDVVGRFFFGKRFSQHKLWGLPFTTATQQMFAAVGDEQYKLSTAIFGANFAKTNILPRHRRLNQAVAEFRAKCREMIKETEEKMMSNQKIGSQEEEKNLLIQLLDMRRNGAQENQYTDEQIIGEFAGLFIAGTETTALLITTSVYYLLHNPHVFQKVKEEVEREINSLNSPLTLDDLNKLEYTTAFLKETLRYGSSVGAFLFRVAVKDDDLCGVKVKKGTFVNIFCPVQHHLEKHYSKSDEFIPERWLDDSRFSGDGCKSDGYSYIPFSAGPRNCTGQYLAILEAKIVLAMFIKRFNFKSSREDYKMKLVQRVSFSPVEPFLVDLEVRK